jgi:alcohol dehydrogenase YqhD (iron-dependent ADH family)
LNDVIEQSFGHLVKYPQNSDSLNRIIKEASEDLNYFLLKIDAHQHLHQSEAIKEHYRSITKEVEKKSLHLLSRLQQIQKADSVKDLGENQ